MDLQILERRIKELAASVGPVDTLLAMARLEDALETLDRAVQSDLDRAAPDSIPDQTDDITIDLREVREVLGRTEPVVARAEVRIADMTGALSGR